jgi:cysteine desulfurase
MRDSDPVYLDYNATTPLLAEVVEAMLPYLREHPGNPSSSHVFGQRARAAVDTAREQVAALLACEPDEIVFTSGGTEANNLAIRGVTEALGRTGTLVTSVVEHPAVAAPCAWLERQGWKVVRLPVDAEGRVSPDSLDRHIRGGSTLVTVMHSNNETGALQPIAAITKVARTAGAVMHTDAAQSVGKLPIDVRALDVDLLSIAGHKLYAPKGVGALYVRRGTALAPFSLGAGHERGLRPGTENVAGIVGLGTACSIASGTLATTSARVRGLRDRLWSLLSDRVPGLKLNGPPEQRLPNTLNIRFPGVSGTALLAATPEVAASTGSACHEGHETASGVLLAMGIPATEAVGSVRLTLGRQTTEDDISRAADALSRAWARLRPQSPKS